MRYCSGVVGIERICVVKSVKINDQPVKKIARFAAVMQNLKTWRMINITNAALMNWAKQAIRTLSRIHIRGWLHRDIKPSNLLWSADSKLYFSDFGSAVKMNDRSDFSVQFRGTEIFAPTRVIDRGYEWGNNLNRWGRDEFDRAHYLFSKDDDWESLIYTFAWLAGERWNEVTERKSLSELISIYPVCELIHKSRRFGILNVF